MRFDHVITLISETFELDAIGQQVPVRSARRVFANEFTVSATEHYAAAAAGHRVSMSYQIRAVDYRGELIALVDEAEYTVGRTSKRGEYVVLTLEAKGANVE